MGYFIISHGDTRGPYTLGQMRSLWGAGKLTGEMVYREDGHSEWLPLSNLAPQLEGPAARRRKSVLSPGQILEVARGQRTLNAVFLLCLLSYLVVVLIHPNAAVASLLLRVPLAVCLYLLGNALGESGVLWLLLGLPCCLGDLTVVLLSFRATSALQAHGIRVGLFGAHREDLERECGGY